MTVTGGMRGRFTLLVDFYSIRIMRLACDDGIRQAIIVEGEVNPNRYK